MNLQILIPHERLINCEISSLTAESIHGSFCLEPRHIDYIAPIVTGILSFTTDSDEQFVGTSDGVLVKAGSNVIVSVRDAVVGVDLGSIREAVQQRLQQREAYEQRALEIARKLEAVLVKRFIELEDDQRHWTSTS